MPISTFYGSSLSRTDHVYAHAPLSGQPRTVRAGWQTYLQTGADTVVDDLTARLDALEASRSGASRPSQHHRVNSTVLHIDIAFGRMRYS